MRRLREARPQEARSDFRNNISIRLAIHLGQYFETLNIPFEELGQQLKQCSQAIQHAIVAIAVATTAKEQGSTFDFSAIPSESFDGLGLARPSDPHGLKKIEDTILRSLERNLEVSYESINVYATSFG